VVRATGGSGVTGHAEVAVGAEREPLVVNTVAEFGRLELLVNNAGGGPKERTGLLDVGEESIDLLYAINLTGPFLPTQLVARKMRV
jgi:NAD(P)-dependent dehydrogenase (short-subunit alcohol dehydrogenase family)